MRDRLSLYLAWAVISIAVGCEPSSSPAPNPTTAPPLPPLPTIQDPSQATPAPTSSPSANAVPPVANTPSIAVLQASLDRVDNATQRLIVVLNSVQDESSASAAAPQIRTIGAEIAEGMESTKATVAALSLSGQDAAVSELLAQRARQQAESGSSEPNLPDALGRVVESPQGPLLRGEINELLDRMLAASTSGGRRGLERMIESLKLRR